ncbi:MAG: rod shape-determining protein MreC [Taibaiella sp.]|nr:rod shape-determining protein MreC [Taibaiella sp.]
MRNFILFISRFFNLILFLALEIVCIVLISRTNSLQGNDIVSSANAVSGLMYKKQNDVVYYFALRRMNDSLLNENARLRTQLSFRNSVDTLRDTTVRKVLGNPDSSHIIHYADYHYLTAHVINNSVSSSNNYITINRGTATGVYKGMGVITGTGAVGKVVNASAHYASILSILSMKQKVSARLKDGTYGYIEWEGDRPDVLMMKDVAQQVRVKLGDTVFTTDYSFFPSDILIGTVYRKDALKKNNMQLLYLRPTVNFRNLQYVYVVDNKLAMEKQHLEDSSLKSKQ